MKAKRQYPARPADWAHPEWPPDTIFILIKAGLLGGKSTGFIRLKSHPPSSHEIAATPALASVTRIIDEWLLIEYAVTPLPVNQTAIVEAVSKSGLPPATLQQWGIAVPSAPLPIAFMPESEIHAAIERRIKAFDFEALARKAIKERMERARGGV